MPKIVNTALKAKAKAWTFEAKAKAKATGPEAKAKAKAIKFVLEAPRGQGLASRTTSLCIVATGYNSYRRQAAELSSFSSIISRFCF